MALRQPRTARSPLFTGRARPAYRMEGDVFRAALDRIRWLYDEFETVQVSTSGGKDSTVLLELTVMVAAERGRLPVQAQWLDQECEFEATVDYMRYLMYEREDVDLRWYQVPFLLENSTNHENPWLKVWDEEHPEDWVRPKEPGSIHDNVYGQDKFHELLNQIAVQDLDARSCQLVGMRVEESQARRMTMMSNPAYKWVTWSNKNPMATPESGQRYRFQPIWDWRLADVWKAIHDNGWRYNTHYDAMFRHGVAARNMRVSNYHHEGALASLDYLQEVEPRTWEAATRRLAGINTYGHLTRDQIPSRLPHMFASWVEYAEYLIENLPQSEEHREGFRRQWAKLRTSKETEGEPIERLAKLMVTIVIKNDFYGTRLRNHLVFLYTQRERPHG